MGKPTQITSLKIPTVSITAARTLVSGESGRTFVLNGGTGFAITLPVVENGLRYRFVVGATFGTDYVITAQSAVINGSLLEAGVVQLCAAATTLTLEDGAETLGDFVDLESDGTYWYVFGAFSKAASVTPA